MVTDAGSVTTSAATPLTSTDTSSAAEAGSVTAAAASPLSALTITNADRVGVTLDYRTATTTWPTVPADRVAVTFDQDESYKDWALDLRPPTLSGGTRITTDFEYRHHQLTLTFRVSTDSYDELRQYAKNAGKLVRPIATDGYWETRDRSLSGNTIVVTPPEKLIGPFIEDTYYLQGYIERHESTRWTYITLTMVRGTPREVSGSPYTEVPAADEWTFDMSNGTLGVADVEATELGADDVYKLTFPVGHDQAKAILESPALLDAVSQHRIPDGDDFARDNTPTNRNTVTINRPSDGSVDANDFTDGTYVVTRWQLSFDAPFRYDAEMFVWPTP